MVENTQLRGVKIKLDAFEGPLDLLLHLIRISEIDIFDIPIVHITEQYIEYLDLMKEVDIDVSSEFMLMAATLIHIKTKLMLPQREDEEDPRAELVERLLEHKHYKEAALKLSEREDTELRIWRSSAKLMRPFMDVDDELIEADIFQLISAFQNVMRSIGRGADIEIEHQHYSINDKIQWFESQIKIRPRLLFSEIVRNIRTKRELVATFLAILELVRRRTVRAAQSSNFGEIVLIATDTSQSVIELDSNNQ